MRFPPENLEQLAAEALLLPTNAIAYHVSQRLAAYYPDAAIVEGEDRSFDIETYSEAGLCTLALNDVIHNLIETAWDGEEKQIVENAHHAWFNVGWQGRTLEVLMMRWREDWSSTEYYWIIAQSKELAEQFFAAVCEWNEEIRDEVLVFEDGCWTKDADLFRSIKNATLDNLVLHGALKHDIYVDLSTFFDARETYEEYGVPWKRGVLFIGPPGNGKTHMVKALINALGRPCLYVKSFKTEHGTDNRNIHAVFERAREAAPCLLVLEDLDSLVNNESRSFFLNELDGFDENIGVVTLATTNHPDRLDPAIVDRPSRFDRKYHFNLPALEDRRAYIALWNDALRPALRLDQTGVDRIASLTDGFSYAYLKELFLSAVMAWIARQQDGAMVEVMSEQVLMLRQQMNSAEQIIRSEQNHD